MSCEYPSYGSDDTLTARIPAEYPYKVQCYYIYTYFITLNEHQVFSQWYVVTIKILFFFKFRLHAERMYEEQLGDARGSRNVAQIHQ